MPARQAMGRQEAAMDGIELKRILSEGGTLRGASPH